MDVTVVLAWAATLSSILSQLVGIEICLRIVRKGSTGDISPVPFFTFFVSACLWFKYGVMQGLYSMMMSNSLGAMLQFLYICVFYIYTIRKVHRLIGVSLLLLFGPLIYIRFFQPDTSVAANQLGLYGCFFTVMCYASPLATLAEVLRNRSCSSISFPLCLVNLGCAVLWYLFGRAISDLYVSLPNVMGILLGLVQMGLFCVYPSKSPSSSSASNII